MTDFAERYGLVAAKHWDEDLCSCFSSGDDGKPSDRPGIGIGLRLAVAACAAKTCIGVPARKHSGVDGVEADRPILVRR